MGWLVTTKGMERGRRYGRDLYDDRLIHGIDRLYMLWVVLTLAIPFAIGYAVDPTWRGGLTGLVWGGLVRIFLFHHMTWSVNSVCHTFGRGRSRPTTRAATTGSSPSRPSARAGTTTTTPSPGRPSTAWDGGRWT